MRTVNVSLVGVGGQGILLTADLLAKTDAMQLDLPGAGPETAAEIAKELSARIGAPVTARRPSVSLESYFLSTVSRDAPEFRLAPFLQK